MVSAPRIGDRHDHGDTFVLRSDGHGRLVEARRPHEPGRAVRETEALGGHSHNVLGQLFISVGIVERRHGVVAGYEAGEDDTDLALAGRAVSRGGDAAARERDAGDAFVNGDAGMALRDRRPLTTTSKSAAAALAAIRKAAAAMPPMARVLVVSIIVSRPLGCSTPMPAVLIACGGQVIVGYGNGPD